MKPAPLPSCAFLCPIYSCGVSAWLTPVSSWRASSRPSVSPAARPRPTALCASCSKQGGGKASRQRGVPPFVPADAHRAASSAVMSERQYGATLDATMATGRSVSLGVEPHQPRLLKVFIGCSSHSVPGTPVFMATVIRGFHLDGKQANDTAGFWDLWQGVTYPAPDFFPHLPRLLHMETQIWKSLFYTGSPHINDDAGYSLQQSH